MTAINKVCSWLRNSPLILLSISHLSLREFSCLALKMQFRFSDNDFHYRIWKHKIAMTLNDFHLRQLPDSIEIDQKLILRSRTGLHGPQTGLNVRVQDQVANQIYNLLFNKSLSLFHFRATLLHSAHVLRQWRSVPSEFRVLPGKHLSIDILQVSLTKSP